MRARLINSAWCYYVSMKSITLMQIDTETQQSTSKSSEYYQFMVDTLQRRGELQKNGCYRRWYSYLSTRPSNRLDISGEFLKALWHAKIHLHRKLPNLNSTNNKYIQFPLKYKLNKDEN